MGPLADNSPDLEAILVRGRGRSGTTMLMGLLATSPEVVCETAYPSESRYLSYLLHVADVVGTGWQDGDWGADELMARPRGKVGPMPFTVELVDRAELSRRSLGGLWSAFSATARSGTSAPIRCYAEKFQFPAEPVVDAGIAVRQLRLVRDPRDAFVSVRSFNARRGYPAFGRQPGQTDEEYVEWFAGWWRHDEAMIDHDEAIGVPTLVVRYEDLVGAPAAEAARVGAWLGVALDAGQVVAARPAAGHHITAPRGVEGSVGRWRTELAPGLAARIEAELGALLERYGY